MAKYLPTVQKHVTFVQIVFENGQKANVQNGVDGQKREWIIIAGNPKWLSIQIGFLIMIMTKLPTIKIILLELFNVNTHVSLQFAQKSIIQTVSLNRTLFIGFQQSNCITFG